MQSNEKGFLTSDKDKWFDSVKFYFNEKDFYYSSYSNLSIHETMLNDKIRTESYRQLMIKNTKTFENKIVLDVGCGTGILSLFAASSGAKHIYAVENSSIALFAQQIIIDNGFENKITLIKGKIEEIHLPVEEVDIIISEWMGYFLLFESMIDSVIFARDKWLNKKIGLIFPDKLCLNMCLSEQGSTWKYSKKENLNNVYGFDFTSLSALCYNEPIIELHNKELICSTSCKILELDMYQISPDDVNFSSAWAVQINKNLDKSMIDDGFTIGSLVIWFDTYFEKGLENPISFTTSPYNTPTHWKQATFYLDINIEKLLVDDKIFGSIAVSKSGINIRELDIKLSLYYPNRSGDEVIDSNDDYKKLLQYFHLT